LSRSIFAQQNPRFDASGAAAGGGWSGPAAPAMLPPADSGRNAARVRTDWFCGARAGRIHPPSSRGSGPAERSVRAGRRSAAQLMRTFCQEPEEIRIESKVRGENTFDLKP